METVDLARPIQIAVGLIVATLLYNCVEGVVAIWSGVAAGSITLLAFGADSYLEVLAAGAVLWRLSYRDPDAGERAEVRARRLIGATFLVLAAAVVFQSVLALASRHGAEESAAGLVLLLVSATVMPAVSFGKLWAAARMDSGVIAAEAKETIACSYLTVTALAGIAATFVLGWWWLDASAALLMVPWLVKEGREGLGGDACFEGERPCFCRTCLFGLRRCTPICCQPACCAPAPA
jgi:divalent metal cation (Fe/Co/Zn/Cd) transporter